MTQRLNCGIQFVGNRVELRIPLRTGCNLSMQEQEQGPGLSSSLLSENGCLKQLREDSQPSERNHVLPRAGQALQAAPYLNPSSSFPFRLAFQTPAQALHGPARPQGPCSQ
jgi:hypothetical protein